MLGHRTDSGRRPRRAACLGPLLLVALATTSARADAPAATGKDTAPIALTADHVRHWTDDGVRYIVLEDHAAIFKGDEGLRADRAVVRIANERDDKGRATYRVDVYAEGKARRTVDEKPPSAELRETWTTEGQVELSATKPQDLIALDLAPPNLPILARAFPLPRPVERTKAQEPPAEPPATPTVTESDPDPLPLPVGTTPVEPPLPIPVADPAVSRTGDDSARGKDTAKAKGKEVDERPVRFRDASYKPVQFIDGKGFQDTPGVSPVAPAPTPPPPQSGSPLPDDFGPSLRPPVVDAPAQPEAMPDPNAEELEPLPGVPAGRTKPKPAAPAPILPGTQRVTTIYGQSGPEFAIQSLGTTADGTTITMIRGGVNIVTEAPGLGLVDIEADSVIIWRKKVEGSDPMVGPDGRVIESDKSPMEFYLEGHVIIRQDRRIYQGKDDQSTYHANRACCDVRNDRTLALDAQVDLFSPGLIAPMKVMTPRADAFHPLVAGPRGGLLPSTFQEIRAEKTVSTGSRFASPGYRFNSKTVDMKKVVSDNVPPSDGGDSAPGDVRTTWRIDARQNVFYMGPVPVFYYPRFATDADDIDPPLRNFSFRTNNYFGQQVLFDFNTFKLLGLRKPGFVDSWNLDIDYLSARKAVAVGTEIGYGGRDPIRDFTDPYHKNKAYTPSIFTDYAGYLDIWGLRDLGRDVLGPGPAIVTAPGEGKKGFQRVSVPAFQEFRGRYNSRFMQSFLTPDSDPYEDARVNLEAGYLSDRQFLEQYYKRLFDIGLDHEDLIYGIRQKDNWAVTGLFEVNPNNFNTETQWLPKLDYYKLGGSLLGNRLTYYGNTGVDYANTHTANEVNNKNIFAFIPYDPVSNTSGVLKTGRAYTSHEIDAPINFGALRVIPYAQGQAVGWNQQIDGQALGRVWGAAGIRADIMAWKAYPNVESELLNVHGFNHKIDFMGDYRDAFSNVGLNQVGVQDDLDDNTYEFVRRYFALTNYAGGVLPQQYDPRFLLLRRAISPITGSTDVQATMETLHFGIHQRLQTKRGPEGRRRIVDYMVFDVDTTYFPNAKRDNFGKPFGQNMYNFEWYIGDRTSIVSYGWFEFFDIGGDPLYKLTPKSMANPFGLNIVNVGVSINRPPRGNIYLGYSIVDTGPLQSSALISSYSYWMSPKWYTSISSSYDFANNILLGGTGSITRVGKDYFVSVGLTANPLQHSYMFAFEIAPRLSPTLRLGSSSNMTRLDTRYAPVQ